MSDSVFLYKLISLCLLKESLQPLTLTQMTDFFLEKGYADYFTVRPVLFALRDDGLIATEEEQKALSTGAYLPPEGNGGAGEAFVLTEEGARTLEAYTDRVSGAIIDDIRGWLSGHAIELRRFRDVRTLADRAVGGGYLVHCTAEEEGRLLLSVDLRVPDAAAAEAVRLNWKADYQKIYDHLLDQLL